MLVLDNVGRFRFPKRFSLLWNLYLNRTDCFSSWWGRRCSWLLPFIPALSIYRSHGAPQLVWAGAVQCSEELLTSAPQRCGDTSAPVRACKPAYRKQPGVLLCLAESGRGGGSLTGEGFPVCTGFYHQGERKDLFFMVWELPLGGGYPALPTALSKWWDSTVWTRCVYLQLRWCWNRAAFKCFNFPLVQKAGLFTTFFLLFLMTRKWIFQIVLYNKLCKKAALWCGFWFMDIEEAILVWLKHWTEMQEVWICFYRF